MRVAVILDIVLGPVEIAAVVLPASAGGVVIAGAWYLARWHSVGSTDQVPAGARGSGSARRPRTP